MKKRSYIVYLLEENNDLSSIVMSLRVAKLTKNQLNYQK